MRVLLEKTWGSKLQIPKAMIICKKRRLVFFVVSAILLCDIVHAELILSAPPRESPDKGRQTYTPVARYLEHILGEEVTYKHPGG